MNTEANEQNGNVETEKVNSMWTKVIQ